MTQVGANPAASLSRPTAEDGADERPGDPEATPSPVDALMAYVRQAGIDAELVAPGVPMPTVPLAAAAIGACEDQILKSLLFQDRGGRLVLAIACGTERVDRDLLAAASGLDRPRLADAATVLATTGYPAGGVPPIGHRTAVSVVMGHRAAALDVAYGGGAAEEFLLRIRPADILRLTDGVVADITGSLLSKGGNRR